MRGPVDSAWVCQTASREPRGAVGRLGLSLSHPMTRSPSSVAAAGHQVRSVSRWGCHESAPEVEAVGRRSDASLELPSSHRLPRPSTQAQGPRLSFVQGSRFCIDARLPLGIDALLTEEREAGRHEEPISRQRTGTKGIENCVELRP